ncbi:hypothetical protein IAD21_01802 [Abditibacteriota bacterium]|nr:hypothetical protein IAD21_01802 [Abditibacteriota bacterium]
MNLNRPSQRVLLPLLALSGALTSPMLAPPARAQAPAPTPQTAVVSALDAQSATISIGRKDGAQLGAVYSLSQGGAEVLRVQITQIREDDSLCRVISLAQGAAVLGETVRFVDLETVPDVPTTTVTPTPTPVPTGPIEVTPTPVPTTPDTTTTTTPNLSGGATVGIAGINGQVVTVGAGFAQGLQSGQTLPVFRGGNIVALVKLSVVEQDSATGTLVYSDPNAPLSVVDRLTVLASPSGTGTGTGTGIPTPAPTETTPVPGVMVPYETGASNSSVPKAENTYELLASLAAQGLIKSQPARLFQDDGARRHRYAEDVIMSRAQIAGFIREAIDNSDNDTSGKSNAALAILTHNFRTDLLAQGVTTSTLEDFAPQGGFSVGVSGFTRARLAGGDTDGSSLLPFDERFGGGRIKTGIDARLNLAGTIGSNLSFYGSFDSGTRLVDGGPNPTTVRKAFLSYDAKRFVRGLTVELGRKEYYWGVGSFGTSLLGDAAGGLDSLSTKFERGSYRFESVYARLGKGPAGGSRSLYGQNLSVKLGTSGRIGIANTLLAPKDSFKAKDFFGAFTPISLYLIDRPTLTRGESGTNAVVSAYAETAVARGVRTYGEIVLDDLSFNANNAIENRNGGTVGVQLFDPKDAGRAGLTLEYSRLNSITYLAFLNTARDGDYEYYYRGAPLGLPIAPIFPTTFGGAESLRADGYFKLRPRLTLFGSAQFVDINTEDQNPAPVGGRGFSRQQVARLALSYDLSRSFVLTGRATYVSTNQPNFVKGEQSRNNTTFSLEIGRSF